jgi:hypothetical protein
MGIICFLAFSSIHFLRALGHPSAVGLVNNKRFAAKVTLAVALDMHSFIRISCCITSAQEQSSIVVFSSMSKTCIRAKGRFSGIPHINVGIGFVVFSCPDSVLGFCFYTCHKKNLRWEMT